MYWVPNGVGLSTVVTTFGLILVGAVAVVVLKRWAPQPPSRRQRVYGRSSAVFLTVAQHASGPHAHSVGRRGAPCRLLRPPHSLTRLVCSALDHQPVVRRRVERAGVEVLAGLELDLVVLGRADREATARDADLGQLVQRVLPIVVVLAQPEAEFVGHVLVGHAEDVGTGLQLDHLGLGEAPSAGLAVDRLAVGLARGREAVVDAILGFEELAGDLGQLDDPCLLGRCRRSGERRGQADHRGAHRGPDALAS